MEGRNINIVNPKEKMIEPFKKIRVCAYVRVSTEATAQLNSFDNQIDYYKNKLQMNPDYEFCGVFADLGISGDRENRPGFQEMIKQAKENEIDLIITKSISRFARKTELLLKIVRELKELGVGIIFEDQNINTLSADGELMLTVLGAFAEEERKSQSESIKLSKRNRFKTGNHAININNLLGYTKNEEGKIIIDEKKAAIVREIYGRYLKGETGGEIVKALNQASVPTYTNNPWNTSRIIRMLANEKYCGDNLMQKFFTDDNGKEKKNRGQSPQYHIKDNHPAIISRGDWEMAQSIRRERHKPYPLSRMLKCPYCGASLVHAKNKRWVYWVCNTKMEHTKKACKGISVPEKKIMALQEKTPITVPMVVMEVENEKGQKARAKKDYCLIPADQYRSKKTGKED
jgi:DNA invertase Pin-like site-specific DNA recombinase